MNFEFLQADFWKGDTLWAVQIFAIVFFALLADFFQRRMLRGLARRLEKTANLWDDALLEAMHKPLSLLIWVLGIGFAAQIAATKAGAEIFAFIDPLRNVLVIVSLTWFLVRFIKEAEGNILAAAEAKGEPLDITTMDAITKLLRLSVMITAGLVVLQTLGFSISGVLAFGGVGGIAVGFAARDLLANFFGGLMIYLDRPFSVGDWVRSPDREIEGTVERIGWRLTVIRTFDKRPLYVPNSVFANIAVENPSRMTNRRIYETFGIRYDDINKMSAITADVETMLKNHTAIDTTKTLMVNFVSCASSSVNFFVYAFTKTTVWTEFHEIKQDILLKIADIVTQNGAQMAFPTSTVHVPDGLVLANAPAVTVEPT